jgi:hypothetical protein
VDGVEAEEGEEQVRFDPFRPSAVGHDQAGEIPSNEPLKVMREIFSILAAIGPHSFPGCGVRYSRGA